MAKVNCILKGNKRPVAISVLGFSTESLSETELTPEGRYLNVVRIAEFRCRPSWQCYDFPIFSPLPDEQILVAFVTSVSAITGCALKDK